MEQHERQQQGQAVIDLTDSPPPSPRPAARLPLAANLPQQTMEQRLQAIKQRDKHAPPPKVKLLPFGHSQHQAPHQMAPTATQPSGPPAPPFPTPQPYMAPQPQGPLLPPPQAPSSSQQIPYGTVYSAPVEGDPLFHEPEPLEGSAGPQISATERDRQLQAMLDNIADLEDDESDASDGQLAGLKCTLMPHQVQGVRWMRERESGKDKGGLLADDMGLGKTVQTLGLIVSNQPGVDGATIDSVRETKKASASKDDSAAKESEAAKEPPKCIKVKGKATLIIAPLAVVQQWASEVQDKTDSLKVYVHHGPKRTTSAARLKQYDVVVTTYATASSEWSNSMGADFFDSDDEHDDSRAKKKGDGSAAPKSNSKSKAGDSSSSESDSDQGSFKPASKLGGKKTAPKASPCPLFELEWLRVVLDEAHTIKNSKTKAAKACYALSSKATSRWCLTGTPIQNDAYEMWSMIHFLGIKPFNDYAHFKEKIGDPLKSSNQNRVNWGMKRLCIVLQSIMLRRTKDAKNTDGSAILKLPARVVEVVEVDFDDPEERDFYTMLEGKMKKNLEVIQEAGPLNHLGVLTMLLRMRQACSHPSLISRKVTADADAVAPKAAVEKGAGVTPADTVPAAASSDDEGDELADMLSALTVQHVCTHCQITVPASVAHSAKDGLILCTACAEAEKARASKGVRWDAAGKGSTKIRLLIKLLKETRQRAQGEKTIVFSQFTSWLDLVEPFLKQAGFQYVRYDGSMTAPKREAALATIRSDPQCTVLLLSFKAGSVGLNLTCCNRVVLCDLWWNPAIEEQAFDRAHRLGQKRGVHVSKLSILNTIEARILELQIKKRALAKAALEGGKLKKGKKGLDLREILFLFNSGPA